VPPFELKVKVKVPGAMGFHFAYTVIFAVIVVAGVNSFAKEVSSRNQPAKVFPALVGFVLGIVMVVLNGIPLIPVVLEPLFFSKVTVKVGAVHFAWRVILLVIIVFEVTGWAKAGRVDSMNHPAKMLPSLVGAAGKGIVVPCGIPVIGSSFEPPFELNVTV
jgi:hypothetical protein